LGKRSWGGIGRRGVASRNCRGGGGRKGGWKRSYGGGKRATEKLVDSSEGVGNPKMKRTTERLAISQKGGDRKRSGRKSGDGRYSMQQKTIGCLRHQGGSGGRGGACTVV